MYKVVILISLLGVCCTSVEFEKYFKTCSRNSIDINDCMVEAVKDGIAAMAGGIEELGIPPVDPYLQKELNLDYNANQISAKMNMKNIYVRGLKGATVKDARVLAEDDRLHVEVDLTAPKIYISGEYNGEGQYNSLKITADGVFNSTLVDLVFTWKMDGVPEIKDGETYMRINSFYMRPDVGTMKTYLSNNNPQTKDITDFAISFSNENWRLLYKEFLPFAQSNWNKTGVEFANKIFLRVPYNKIFPATS